MDQKFRIGRALSGTRQWIDMHFLLALLLVTAPFARAAEPKRLELGFPGLAHRIEIVFPYNFDPAKSYPAMLFYHGTNGTPDTTLIRRHTAEDDWFTVGMTYVQQGKFTFSPETLESELTILRSVRHHLVTKYSVDPKRVYVGGFSKGGWLAGLFLQAEPGLAGAVILGAGHLHQVKAKPVRFSGRTPVFVGVGRQDGNYPFALQAITFYRGLGATTTLETWHDHGHQFPAAGSPALTQWLALEGKPEADHKAAAQSWATASLRELRSLSNPVQRWAALLALQACPYYSLLEAPGKSTFGKMRSELEQSPPVSTEARTLATHRKLLRAELESKSREDYQKILGEYNRLARSVPDTRQGTIAQHDVDRIKTLLKHFDEQEALRGNDEAPFGPDPEDDPFDPGKTDQPNDRIRIPRNPLVR